MSIQQLARREGLEYANNNVEYTFENVDCSVNQKNNHFNGTLYLTKDFLIFVSCPEEDYSIVIEYQSIGVHAVTHDTIIWNRPCVYCQLSQPNEENESGYDIVCGDISLDRMEDEEGEDAMEDEQEDTNCAFELLISPVDSSKIDSLFDCVSRLQLIHPDPVKEEDLNDDGMFMTANGLVSVEDHLCSLFDKAAAEYENRSE